MSAVTFMSFEELTAAEERNMALVYVSEAFAEATLDGIDVEAFAQAAFAAALRELVALYGEERTTKIAERLPDRVRAGEFTSYTRQ